MKTYINHIIKLCILILGLSLNAQRYPVQVTQTILPPYSSKLSDYVTATNVKFRLDVLLTDVVASNRQVRLKLRIKGNGLDIQSRDVVAGAPQVFLNGGVLQQFTNLDLAAYFQPNNLIGITPQQYNRPLPEGVYTVCWEVHDVITNQQINNPVTGCSSIFLLLNDPPFLNLPYKGDQLVAKDPMNIIFQWTPRHTNATNVSYEFELREIWDANIDPQAAFLASPNYYTETVNTTTVLYDISKPVLLPKKKYGWRVRAKSLSGISENAIFKNDGYSEVFYFSYTDKCDAPTFVLSEALSSNKVKITWQGNFEHKKYHVQYKREDIADAEWFDVYTYNSQAQIANLKEGKTYVFRVGGSCNELNDPELTYSYSVVSQFTMPKREDVATYNCGIIPEIEIKDTELLKNLGVNETFTAGDFPVTVKMIRGGNGIYSGKGFIVVPYLADTKIAVTFSSIKINEDYQLVDGVIRTTYDPTWGGVSDVNDMAVGGDGNSEAITVDFVIEDVKVDPNGDIIVIGSNGEIVELPGGEDQVITDSNGETWSVDEEGNVTKTGQVAEGGASNPQNTNGVNNQGEVTAITAEGVVVTFTKAKNSTYGFDAYDKSEKETKDLYKKLNDNYFVPYKAVANGKTETIIANFDISDKNIKPEDIVFKTKDGIAIAKVDSTSTSYTLELNGAFTDANIETQALVKQKDKYEVAGAFIQYQAKIKEVDVVLVNTANSNTEKIKEELQSVYNQALVKLHIKEINNFTNDLESLVTDNTIESGKSGFAAQYTSQQREINKALKSRTDFNKSAYYLILTNKKPSTKEEKGLMPLGRQFGYVYMNNGADEHTIAHELGHGAFQLKHPFSDKSYGYSEKETNWLLDYKGGDKIPYVHWKEIHNPKLRIGLFDKDTEGEHYTKLGLFRTLKFGTNKDKTFTFITPSGQYIILPNNVSNVTRFYGFYGNSGEDNKEKFNQFLSIVPGTLRKFSIEKRVFTARLKIVNGETTLEGYFDENKKPYKEKEFGINAQESFAKNKKSILYALGSKNKKIGYYIYLVDNEKVNLSAYSENSVVRDITEFPIQDLNNIAKDIKKLKFSSSGSQHSITTENVTWAFDNYRSSKDQILRNKMAELKALYPRYMDEVTKHYADWNNEDAICSLNYSNNFDTYLRDLFCKATSSDVGTGVIGHESTITTYNRNTTSLPKNSFEWQKLFYTYIKDNLFKLREELSASILEYNKTPELITEHHRSKIAKVSNLASEDDIKQLRADVVLQLVSKIVHKGFVTEGSVPASDYEGAILNLLKKANKRNYKEILLGLEGKNHYSKEGEKSFLFKELYDGIHDFGTESNNALKLVSILTEMMLKSGDFYKERSLDAYNNLGERAFILDYNNFIVATGKSLLYGNVFFQIADGVSNDYLENSLETYDISYKWLEDEKKISLKQYQEVGFFPTHSEEPRKLRPFDLIRFINVSNLSAVKGLEREIKLTDVPLPAVVAMYGSEKASQETIEQGISTTIDVVSLAASGGAITAIKGLATVDKMRKAFYLFDVASSGLSLISTFLSDSEENDQLRGVLNSLSAVTGIVSMGDLGLDAYSKIKNAATLSKRINQAKQSVDIIKSLPNKELIEQVFDNFKKISDTELDKFVSKYPDQAENAIKITIKYLKDAVKSKNTNKVNDAKLLLSRLGKTVSKNASSFITKINTNPKLLPLKEKLDGLKLENEDLINQFTSTFGKASNELLEKLAGNTDLVDSWRVLFDIGLEHAIKSDIDQLTVVNKIIEKVGGYKSWKLSEAGKNKRLWKGIELEGDHFIITCIDDTTEGAGKVVFPDEDVISFDLHLPGFLESQGIGTKTVELALGVHEPKKVKFDWHKNSKVYDRGAALSFIKFKELVKKLDKYEAALATPGGRVMKKFGYDNVTEVKNGVTKVTVFFTRKLNNGLTDLINDVVSSDIIKAIHKEKIKEDLIKSNSQILVKHFKDNTEEAYNSWKALYNFPNHRVKSNNLKSIADLRDRFQFNGKSKDEALKDFFENIKEADIDHTMEIVNATIKTFNDKIPVNFEGRLGNVNFIDVVDNEKERVCSVFFTDGVEDLKGKKMFVGGEKVGKYRDLDIVKKGNRVGFYKKGDIFQETHEVLKNVEGRPGEYIVKHDLSEKELCSGWFVNGINTKEVEFALQTVFDNVRYASGKKVRQAVLDEMSNGNLNDIDAIRSEWISGGGLETNIGTFQKEIDKGLTIEEAIFKTKAGQWNKELGFNKVEILGKSVTSSNKYRSIQLRFVRGTVNPNFIKINNVKEQINKAAKHSLKLEVKSNGNFKKGKIKLRGTDERIEVEGFEGVHTRRGLKEFAEKIGGEYAIVARTGKKDGVYDGVPVIYLNEKHYVKINGFYRHLKGIDEDKVGNVSTFFPDHMTDEKIMEEAIHALENNQGFLPNRDDLIFGFSKDEKIKFKFKIDKNKKVKGFYPEFNPTNKVDLPNIGNISFSSTKKSIRKILDVNVNAFPKNIDLLGFNLGTKDDNIIDIIIHSNSRGDFIMNVEGKQKTLSGIMLAKLMDEIPSNQKIRLLSCNEDKVAIELSKLTDRSFYASHGSVKLYEDGTIVHETPFKKYHKGARSDLDEIPPQTNAGKGAYIELGLFGGKTLKELVEKATLYFNPWSYHDIIRIMYADTKMKEDYVALSKMFGIYKEFKGKNIGKTNRDYSKGYKFWPNKLKGSDDRVKYLESFEERKKYEVYVKDGKLYTDGKELSKIKGYLDGEIIFIMDKDGTIYAGIGRPGFFHHSSFLAGGDIITGGEFKFINKSILEIKPKSGHYSPSLDSLKAVIEELSSRGFDIRNMKINPDVR